jgi:predicted RNA binding protein YcfA (HicA-like mRNA interferase family)
MQLFARTSVAQARQGCAEDDRITGAGLLKVRDAVRLNEKDGWFLVATRGSHRQYKHPTRPGRVTSAGKPSDDISPGTLNSILKQAGLKEQR